MDETERSRLQAEIATLHLLLEANESSALAQARRADRAILDLHAAAAAREQQAQQLREVAEASIDAVFVLDAEWTVRYVNLLASTFAALATPDRDTPGMIGRNLFTLFPGLHQTSLGPMLHRVMTGRTAVRAQDFYPPSDSWLEISASPVGDGIAIFLRDITDARKQEDILRRSEKLAAVGRLASSISHEINNPLESVVNLLYLIEHSSLAGDEMRTYAALATSELARVSHIVTQTLKFHRQSTKPQRTRIADLLDSVTSLFQGRLTGMNVRLHRRFAAQDTIFCLAGDLRQVFANLIGNALDALSGTGDLWLRTTCSRDWKTGTPGLRVTVADNGGGMTRKTRDNLFEAFYTTKPATGTGLGLWVSQGIVASHRGKIFVRSSQKSGCTGTVFTVFFPLEPEN